MYLNVRDERNGLAFVEFGGHVRAPTEHHRTNDVHHALKQGHEHTPSAALLCVCVCVLWLWLWGG